MKLCVLVLTLLAFPVHAGTYGGIFVGSGSYDIDFRGSEHGYDSESGQTLSMLLGDDDDMPLEVEYAHLGSYYIRNDTNETTASIQGLSVSYVPRMGWAFAKVGIESYRISASFNGHPEAIYGAGLVYGFGVHAKIKPNAYLRVGVDVHPIDDQRINANPGITRGYAGVLVNF